MKQTVKRTVELPNELNERLDIYLREHPGESVSSVIQRALEKELTNLIGEEFLAGEPRDLTPLLELAGFVKELKQTEYDPARPEDSVMLNIRDSRDI